MGATQSAELNPVFQHPLDPVGPGHVGAIISADVAEGDQGTQRLEGTAGTHPFVSPAVDELQKLHGELGVPQPPDTEFDFPVGLLGGDQGDDPVPQIGRAHV